MSKPGPAGQSWPVMIFDLACHISQQEGKKKTKHAIEMEEKLYMLKKKK